MVAWWHGGMVAWWQLCYTKHTGHETLDKLLVHSRDGIILNSIMKGQDLTRQYCYRWNMVLKDNIRWTIISVLLFTHSSKNITFNQYDYIFSFFTHPVTHTAYKQCFLCKVCTSCTANMMSHSWALKFAIHGSCQN